MNGTDLLTKLDNEESVLSVLPLAMRTKIKDFEKWKRKEEA